MHKKELFTAKYAKTPLRSLLLCGKPFRLIRVNERHVEIDCQTGGTSLTPPKVHRDIVACGMNIGLSRSDICAVESEKQGIFTRF